MSNGNDLMTPRWSVVGQLMPAGYGHAVAGIWSMAGLSASNAIVLVGPPLALSAPKEPSRVDELPTLVALNPHVASSPMLWPLSVTGLDPPQSPPAPALEAIVPVGVLE